MGLSAPKNGGMGTCKKGAKMQHGQTCKFTCKDGFLPIGSQPECQLGEEWQTNQTDGAVISTFGCAYIGTCASVKDNHKGVKSGLFALDVDGKGPKRGFKAYCDMETEGGGFQLVMRRVHGHPAVRPTALPEPRGGSGYISDTEWKDIKPSSGKVLIKFDGKPLEGVNSYNPTKMLLADIDKLKTANCKSWANATSLGQNRMKPLFADGEKTCKMQSSSESFMFGPDQSNGVGKEVYFMDKSKNSLYTRLGGAKNKTDGELMAWSVAEMWVKDGNPPPPPKKMNVTCLDLNGDGETNALDLMELLGAYGLNDCELRTYDLNGDCIVGSTDLMQVLSAFGCMGKDCKGNAGGKARKDQCGVCDGDGSSCADCYGVANGNAKKDCAGKCGGKAKKDMCGNCDSEPTNDCKQDCAGKWGGQAKPDCAKKCGGKAVKDKCGKCDDNPKNDCKQDCEGEWGGNLVKDCWGNCGGKAKKDKCGLCDDNPKNDCDPDSDKNTNKTIGGKYCDPVLITMSTSKDAKSTTYRLAVKLKGNAASATGIEGSSKGQMFIPPAYQVKSYGVNIGGVSKDAIKSVKAAEFDSWLTVGITDGDSKKELGNAGLKSDMKAWNEKQGINNKDCSVFWFEGKNSTAKGQKAPIVLAQLTVPSNYRGHARMGVFGQPINGKKGEHWRDNHIQWYLGGK